MEVMSQERYKEYRKSLKDQGYPVFETISQIPDEETYKKLEERIGPMPWDLLKYPVPDFVSEMFK